MKDRGTALISALLTVALMSALAVELVDNARFSLARSSNIQDRDQAYWHARGAREFAEQLLSASVGGADEIMRPSDPWVVQSDQTFPIEDGVLVGRIEDGNNCFNINTLLPDVSSNEDDPAALTAEQAGRSFTALMDGLAMPPGVTESVRAQIIDWIDADAFARPGGAEDRDFARFSPPYRAANQRFVELEEILALPVMTPALFAALEPWLCVRPEAVRLPVNVNTLRIDQAPLLAAALHGELTLADAETVLFRRPVQGYEDLAEFWADPLMALVLEQSSAPALQSAVTLRSRWFEIDVDVRLRTTRFSLETLAVMDDQGRLQRRSQRFGSVS
ncbi:MAG: type II secretion system minor pseudopilin GspK [Pseudomonadota bacterium]